MANKNIVFILTIIFLIILFSFRLTVFDMDFYKGEFVKHGVYDKFESADIVDENAKMLMDYLKGDKELHTHFFNDKEKEHMKDVKGLFDSGFILFYVSLILFILFLVYLFYNKRFEDVGVGLIYGGVSSLAILVFVSLASFIDFGSFFVLFHKVFFRNDLWILDPAVDNMINMFPQGFFYDAVIKIFVIALLILILFILCGLVFKYRKKLF